MKTFRELALATVVVYLTLSPLAHADRYFESCGDNIPCLEMTLFNQVSYQLERRESDLVCGPEPELSDLESWYSFGDCSGYYGPIDQVR